MPRYGAVVDGHPAGDRHAHYRHLPLPVLLRDILGFFKRVGPLQHDCERLHVLLVAERVGLASEPRGCPGQVGEDLQRILPPAAGGSLPARKGDLGFPRCTKLSEVSLAAAGMSSQQVHLFLGTKF